MKRNPGPVSVAAMCRGEGLGYLSFKVDEPRANLTGVARSKDGRPVPCEVLPGDAPASWIAVVPLLADDVFVTVRTGAERLAELTFPALRSKLASRLLSVANPQVAASLRGVERRRGSGDVRVNIAEAWPSVENRVAWRVRATFPTRDADADVALQVFDTKANRVEARVIVMEDHVVPAARDRAAQERVVTFSCELPEQIASFYVVARLDKETSLLGFDGMNAPRAQGMLADTRLRIAGAAADPAYGAWFDEHRATPFELAAQRRACEDLDENEKPLVSIVMPVFRTDGGFLEAAIQSVVRQSYDRWELVIVNASGPHAEVDEVLQKVDDERVRVLTVENRSIAENTNAGIAAAEGDYVAFLDHDDVLEPDALWRYVQATRRESHADLLYCDEDRLDGSTLRTPAFKTFPNYGKLYTHNYVTHFLMVSRFVLEHTARSGPEVAGAQDYDLTLKAFEVARTIVHVPHVLYHWRDHAGSTAGGSDQKPYAHEAGRRALAAHLGRRGIEAEVADGPLPCTYDVRYALPSPQPKVSIVIPTRDQPELLTTCVESILERSTYQDFEVVLVENNSTDPRTFALYEELAARDGRVRMVVWQPPEPGAFNYAAVVNHGVAQSTGDVVVLLNNDTEVIEPSWIEEMLGCLGRPEVGVVGAKLLFGDGLVQHVGMVANGNGDFCHVCQNIEGGALGPAYAVAMPGDYSMVTGACQMVRRSVFERLGGYDERLTVGFNDGDFCLRAKELGLVSTVASHAVLYHREFATRGRETSDVRLRARYLTERGRMLVRHAAFLAQGDPALNPNLDSFGTYFEL